MSKKEITIKKLIKYAIKYFQKEYEPDDYESINHYKLALSQYIKGFLEGYSTHASKSLSKEIKVELFKISYKEN